MIAKPPLTLYVHIPWCIQKCPYCDFNSHALQGELPEKRYVDALIRDLESQQERVTGRFVETIFFGGGTPSLFSAQSLGRLITEIKERLRVRDGAEITLEANPGTMDAARFVDFRGAGINRLSLGIQSFDEDKLRALGRIHGAREAHQAAAIARQQFANFNLDMMTGLPGQTVAEAQQDIYSALAYDPPHLSCYALTLEPNTPFYQRPPVLPAPEVLAELEMVTQQALREANYENYEVSAWAHSGNYARHNLNYWEFGDYLGIGAGAHGKLSGTWGVERQRRTRHPQAYMKAVELGHPIEEAWTVQPQDLPFEFMMNALRLRKGVNKSLYERHTGQSSQGFRELSDALETEGWLEKNDQRWVATTHGQNFLNDLLQRFLP